MIVTITVLVIVDVLLVPDMVVLDSPLYAAAGSAEASDRSKAMPRATIRGRATINRRFIDIPSICSESPTIRVSHTGSVIIYAAQLQYTVHHGKTPPSALAPLQQCHR